MQTVPQPGIVSTRLELAKWAELAKSIVGPLNVQDFNRVTTYDAKEFTVEDLLRS